VTCSGTVALYVTLNAIQKITTKRTVVIPAFICPLVGLAVARAGLTLAVCDTQPSAGLDYDLDALEAMCQTNPDMAAIVVAHLGGMAADMDRLQQLARTYDVLLIEDCAQAFGAEYDGKKVGTMGDFAFYSFARGKGLTLYEGGVLVTRHEKYVALLEAEYQRLVPKDFLAECGVLLGLFGYAIFYRPQLFWFIFDNLKIICNF
jgi:dTDP-4-amino-4,6-dideoxygalactose transaminase